MRVDQGHEPFERQGLTLLPLLQQTGDFARLALHGTLKSILGEHFSFVAPESSSCSLGVEVQKKTDNPRLLQSDFLSGTDFHKKCDPFSLQVALSPLKSS
jgi:hypothetical protein